ncbi:hypothetical protein L2E82_39819 [Cichorium intybus]|uniref:Uncharacterized protein n=1 Tax=Cichorium intybus TaxID=13427 RepID=A0ACB9AJ99_CICIN|nr:hypothetical protein L2E82_39819 [Cichorium intybus]
MRPVPYELQQTRAGAMTSDFVFVSDSPREIRQGEEIAWYADGETIVRNEHTQSIAYAYDRVFGPITTTRHVYDIAAHHVVGGAMEGVNGAALAIECFILTTAIQIEAINREDLLRCSSLLKKQVLEKAGSFIRISSAADSLIWRVELQMPLTPNGNA